MLFINKNLTSFNAKDLYIGIRGRKPGRKEMKVNYKCQLVEKVSEALKEDLVLLPL